MTKHHVVSKIKDKLSFPSPFHIYIIIFYGDTLDRDDSYSLATTAMTKPLLTWKMSTVGHSRMQVHIYQEATQLLT